MRVLLVGAGLMARWHLHAARRLGAEILGVVDPDDAARAGFSRAHAVAAHARLEGGLAQEPELVHICSPPETHLELIHACLASGAHVLVEKPLAPDSASTAAALAEAEARGLTLTPVHQLGFQPWRAQVPSVGPIRSIEVRICSAGAGPDPRALSAGIACHGLAIFALLLGPERLDVRWSSRIEGGELAAMARTTGAGGAQLSLSVSLAGRPPRNELVVVGERATLHADLFHGFGWVDRGGADRLGKLSRPVLFGAGTASAALRNLAGRAARREPAFPGLQELVRQVYAATTGAPPPLSPAHVQAVADARDAILANP